MPGDLKSGIGPDCRRSRPRGRSQEKQERGDCLQPGQPPKCTYACEWTNDPHYVPGYGDPAGGVGGGGSMGGTMGGGGTGGGIGGCGIGGGGMGAPFGL